MADLVLNLKAEYFDAIKRGEKAFEYRLRSLHWRRRLECKTFERVVLCKGYPAKGDAERRLVLPWRGYDVQTITHPFFGEKPVDVFAIRCEVAP